MTKKQLVALSVFLLIVAVFFVVSAILAHVHDNTLVVEWQSWFGIIKDAVEQIPPEETDEVVETSKILLNLLKI